MGKWTRRTFLRRLGASVVALTLARTLPGIAAREQRPQWMDALAQANLDLFNPSTDLAKQYQDGFALRYAIWTPDFAVRVQG